jgi:hypothetical protein
MSFVLSTTILQAQKMKTVFLVLALFVVYITCDSCASFDTTKYGGRKPDVSATASGSTVTITVNMYRQSTGNAVTPVFHNVDTKVAGNNVCRTTSDNIVDSAGVAWVHTTSNGCTDTYTLTQTLSQIVSGGVNNNWSPSLGPLGRSIVYTLPIHLTYSVNAQNCYYIAYPFAVSFRTQLSIASTSSEFVTSDIAAKFALTGIRITPTNNLEIAGKITPLIQDTELRNIVLTKTAGNIQITTATSTCSAYNVGCDQIYTVSVATISANGADISDTYVTNMEVWENNVKTRDTSLSYALTYTIPSDPTVVDSDTIQTENKLYTSNTYSVIRTASYNSAAPDSLYIENGITAASPVIPTGYKLRMAEGYLCCVSYLSAIPAYNPTTDTGGCKDSAGKLEYVNLGSEVSHPLISVFTPAESLGNKKYRMQVPLNTAYATSNPNPAVPMTCQVLLISKLEAPQTRRIEGASNLNSKFVSTVPFFIEASKVMSSANAVGISIAAVMVVLVNMLL